MEGVTDMIRVSSTQFTYNYKISLNNAYAEQAKLMEQADGNSIHRPSDDSVNYARYLKYGVAESENLQYQKNVKTAVSWMQNADAAEVLMSDIMSTFKEKTDAAANSTNTEADMKAIGREMMSGIQQLVSLGNTQQGDNYVFGGQSVSVRPFELSMELADRGLTKTLDDKQSAFFFTNNKDVNKYNDTDLGILRQFLVVEYGEAGNEETAYLDTITGYVYSKDFVEEDDKTGKSFLAKMARGETLEPEKDAIGKIKVGDPSVTADYTDGDKFMVSKYFDERGVIKKDDAGNNIYTITASNDNSVVLENNLIAGKPLKLKTISQPIVTYTGDEKHISMVKLNGAVDPTADTVNSTGQELFGADIFDNRLSGNGRPKADSGNTEYVAASGSAMINEMLTVYAMVNSGDKGQIWLDTDGVTISDKAHANLVTEEARIGARNQLYTSVTEMLDKQNENITRDLTDVSATDVAELAVQLMTQQTLYNLSLSMGSRILPQSLADYL